MSNKENIDLINNIIVVNLILIIIQDLYEKEEITKEIRDFYFKFNKTQGGLNLKWINY